MTKIEKAQFQVDAHFLSFRAITASQLKEQLEKNWNDELWSNQWVSGFLRNSELEYEVYNNTRIYQAPLVLTLQHLKDLCEELVDLGEDITKTNLKSMLRGLDLPLGNFKELFSQLGLQHNGKYTADNHKIWVSVPTGKHLSRNKGTLVDIKDMAKPYLRNAIAKYVADYGQPDMHYILGQPNSEFYKLLAAFFTFEIRNSI